MNFLGNCLTRTENLLQENNVNQRINIKLVNEHLKASKRKQNCKTNEK